MKSFEGKNLSCWENFGANFTETANCEGCLDAMECERRTFQLKQPIMLLEK